LTNLWDLEPRRLEGWSKARTLGDPIFDDALLTAYQEAIRTFSSRGARVVWMKPPCIAAMDAFGSLTADSEHQERLAHLSDRVLSRLDEDPAVSLFDLDAVLCPGGRFQSSIDGVEKIRMDGVHFSVEG